MTQQHTVWDNRSFDDGTQQLSAVRKPEGLKTTANGVYQAQPGSLKRKVRIDLKSVDIISDVLKNLIWFWAQGRLSSMSGHGSAVYR
jgi:hypothetical protein